MMNKIVLSTFLLVLFGSVGYFSTGYDDEFFNIRLIEKLGFGVIPFLQTTDIHPPGSYIIDSFLYGVFNKWEIVRLIISLLTATSLLYAILSIEKRNGRFAGIVSFVLLGLNPSILLWCTSIRWYAFFVPVLIWLSIVPQKQGWKYWSKCFLGLTLLGYLGYAFLIVALPILILYWVESKEDNLRKMKNIFLFGSIFLILYSYQLFIFITVHFKNKDTQVSSLLKSMYGLYSSQISNQGVFPLSIPGIITSLATIGIFTTILFADFKSNIKNKYFVSYFLATFLASITGVASKIRNLVIISPWQAFFISTAKVKKTEKKFFVFFIAFLTIGNLWGDFNIVTHQNTIKSNFNLPVQPILEDLKIENSKCKNDLIILCHDPKLTWHLNHSGYLVIGPYSHSKLTPQMFQSKHQCVVVLKTWTGVTPEYLKKMYQEVDLLKFKKIINSKFGRDDFYVFKQKLNGNYPEYMIEVMKLYDVENIEVLKSWMPVKSTILGN